MKRHSLHNWGAVVNFKNHPQPMMMHTARQSRTRQLLQHTCDTSAHALRVHLHSPLEQHVRSPGHPHLTTTLSHTTQLKEHSTPIIQVFRIIQVPANTTCTLAPPTLHTRISDSLFLTGPFYSLATRLRCLNHSGPSTHQSWSYLRCFSPSDKRSQHP